MQIIELENGSLDFNQLTENAIKTLFIILLLVSFLFSCKKQDSCLIHFYITGTVVDKNGTPIVGADVYYVTHYGYEGKETETDSNGKYKYFAGSYSDLGNSHITTKKSGFKDTVTTGIGKGSEACGDQQIIRDAVMETQ